MELEGTIIQDLPLQEGISKAGNPWMKKEWVLETNGLYPRRVKFHVFGKDRIDNLRFEVGKSYAVTFELESREFNGRWYTDVNVMSARLLESPNMGQAAAPQPMGGFTQEPAAPIQPMTQQPVQDPFAGEGNTDDLPF